MCWCDRLSVRYARSATTDRYLCHQMENVRLWFLWLHRLRWYIWGFKSSPSISIQSFVYLRRMLLTSPIPCLLQFLEIRPYITFKCFCYYSQTVVESVNASTWPSPWGRGTSNQTFQLALQLLWGSSDEQLSHYSKHLYRWGLVFMICSLWNLCSASFWLVTYARWHNSCNSYLQIPGWNFGIVEGCFFSFLGHDTQPRTN